MNADLAPMQSFFDRRTSLSVLVPVGWTGELLDHGFRFYGPPSTDHDGYRSTMSFQAGEGRGRRVGTLEALAAETLADMERQYPGFELQGEDRFVLSSLAPVYARSYTWTDPGTGFDFVQLQAMIPARSFYLINGATIRELRDDQFPLLRAMLDSTRIIPNA